MRRRSQVLLAAAGALLVAGWLTWGLEKVTDPVDVPASGPAAANPFFAAEQTLDALGVHAVSAYRLEGLPPADHALLLLAPDPTRGEADVDALWAWMDAGGDLLVVPSPPAKAEAEDPAAASGDTDGDTAEAQDPSEVVPQDPVLARAGVWLIRQEVASLPGEVLVDVPGWDESLRAALDPGLQLAYAKAEDGPPRLWASPAFARFSVGKGTLTVLVDSTPFDNNHLGQAQHARLLWALLAREGEAPAGALLVVEGRPPSLWALLARHAGLSLWSGGALLLAWLWGASRRLGPPLPDAPPARRSLLEQMDAVGNFLWRRGQVEVLLRAGRAVVSRRVARLHPGVFLLDAEDQAAALAEETATPVSSVRRALSDPFPTDAAGAVATVQALQALAGPKTGPAAPSRRSS